MFVGSLFLQRDSSYEPPKNNGVDSHWYGATRFPSVEASSTGSTAPDVLAQFLASFASGGQLGSGQPDVRKEPKTQNEGIE